jgi:hypothetical protein
MEITTSLTHQCRFCQKLFQRERSLEVHLCEPKRRHQEQHEPGVRLGFQAYIKFYESTQGSARLKTHDDFATSQYYKAFVKWGRYCVDIHAIDPEQFLLWLLKNNKKIDGWCSDRVYDEYLKQYLPREGVQSALERGVKEMHDYADQHPELKNGYADYFRYAPRNRVCYQITTGRISPWLIYNSKSGVEFLDSVTPDQLDILMPWIDPDTWQKIFADRVADVEWARHILHKAGL